ncbi:hypothetical protein C1908_07985 [Listeria ivanovii]|nr:hypothetical protein C1908_07985 [Listeria ivanovii]
MISILKRNSLVIFTETKRSILIFTLFLAIYFVVQLSFYGNASDVYLKMFAGTHLQVPNDPLLKLPIPWFLFSIAPFLISIDVIHEIKHVYDKMLLGRVSSNKTLIFANLLSILIFGWLYHLFLYLVCTLIDLLFSGSTAGLKDLHFLFYQLLAISITMIIIYTLLLFLSSIITLLVVISMYLLTFFQPTLFVWINITMYERLSEISLSLVFIYGAMIIIVSSIIYILMHKKYFLERY